MILSDQEINSIAYNGDTARGPVTFARAIEAAILRKIDDDFDQTATPEKAYYNGYARGHRHGHDAAIAKLAAVSVEPCAYRYTGIKNNGDLHGPHLVFFPAYMDAMSAHAGAVAEPLYPAEAIAAARVQENERCAKVCDVWIIDHSEHTDCTYIDCDMVAVAADLATSIRALVGGGA